MLYWLKFSCNAFFAGHSMTLKEKPWYIFLLTYHSIRKCKINHWKLKLINNNLIFISIMCSKMLLYIIIILNFLLIIVINYKWQAFGNQAISFLTSQNSRTIELKEYNALYVSKCSKFFDCLQLHKTELEETLRPILNKCV